MGAIPCKFFWLLFCACAITSSAFLEISGAEPSPRVRKLVDESAHRNAIEESDLLNKKPLIPADMPEALGYIKSHADYTSYHLILTLRTYYPETYLELAKEQKAAILCSALENIISLNDFGYLAEDKCLDGPSATALIDTGKAALKYLLPMLDNDKKAPLFGEKEATMSWVYKYRRKDFAYRYATLILGQSPAFAADPRERDKSIAKLKDRLTNDRK